MKSNKQLDPELEPLIREAFDWIVRLTSGSATQEDARAFERWRAQGDDHASAFREAAAFRKAARAMELPNPSRTAARIIPIQSRSRPTLLDRRALFVGGGAIAASAAAVITVRPPLGLWPSLSELTADHRTGVGERKTLGIGGNAIVELNARSALSIIGEEDGVDLVTGEAFVTVKRTSAEFVVTAGGEHLSSAFGAFNVRTSTRESRVTCLSGALWHGRSPDRRLLRPGDQFVAVAGEPARFKHVDPLQASGWRRGLLIFRGTPLAEALEDINRYHNGKIILARDALAARPVNGIFHIDQINNAVAQLQQLLRLDVTKLPGGIILMS